MDPQQSRCYSQAQRELQELFREISSQGQVSANELQGSLLPFTAGDVRNDVLELMDELRRRQPKSSVDEKEFIRVMWKKMYLSHLTYSSKSRPSSAHSTNCKGDAQEAEFNIPLAHVIVSIKRRSQLKQFADYYASRGISGADHLTAAVAPATESTKSAHHHRSSPTRHRRVCFDRNIPIPVASLRAHTSSSYKVIACVFEPDEGAMQTLQLFPRGCQVVNCSKLYCLLFTKDAGNYLLGSAHFAQQVYQEYQESVRHKRESGGAVFSQPQSAMRLPAPLALRNDVLIVTKLEDLGLRNVVTAASSHGSFVACTERKIHQWTEATASRPLDADVRSSPVPQSDKEDDSVPGSNNSFTPAVIDLEAEGDCFGVLGGKKLLARTKNIADIPLVKQLSAGTNFAMALTSSSALFAWGKDAMLGHYELVPWRVPWFPTDRVARVSCGRNHVLVATAAGCAFSWGSNVYGQLGHGRKCSIMDPPVSEPIMIKIPAPHSHHRQSHSRIATTGSNSADPLAPDSDHAVLDVACGDDHSLLLLGSGQLLAFGNNWQGQLGIEPKASESGCVYEPTEVVLPVLDESAHDHALIVSAPGPGPQSAVISPRAYLVSAYGSTTAAVTTHGDVFVWGKCVASGLESVCGLVSRWEPQLLDLIDADEGDGSTNGGQSPGLRPTWHSIAIANGLVVLTKHTE